MCLCTHREKIKGFADWRGNMLARVRQIIQQADPETSKSGMWIGGVA